MDNGARPARNVRPGWSPPLPATKEEEEKGPDERGGGDEEGGVPRREGGVVVELGAEARAQVHVYSQIHARPRARYR